MTKRVFTIAILLFGAWVPLSHAQKVEFSPFVGYRWGGSVSDITGISYDLDATMSYGAGLEFALSNEAHLGVVWSHQSTGVTRFSYDDDGRTDLDIDYLHFSGVYIFDPESKVRPFVGASIGATRLASVGQDSSSSTQFSLGIGGGVKLMFNQHVGIRLDGRFFGTFAGNGGFAVGCGPAGCLAGFGGDFLWQGEIAAGLIIGF